MCGFVAYVSPAKPPSVSFLETLGNDIAHRGPDARAEICDGSWGLSFRRLAIIDPTERSDQPFTDRSGAVTLVFNGEIYNFRSLRSELESTGTVFRTSGDTEVVLEGYLRWGEGVFDRLEGMYAVAIVDRTKNRMIAARDPLGIKPLYATTLPNGIAFASEMRPLYRLTTVVPDEHAMGELLAFSWAAGSMSNIQGIERVPGGTIVTVDLQTGSATRRRFFDILDTLNQPETAEISEVEEALADSIKAHTMSDVGYALQLSGGVDSSLVAACTAGFAGQDARDGIGLKSFGVRIPGYEHDEAPYRSLVAEQYGLDHHEVTLDGEAFADALPKAVRHMEGPVPHGGCVMLMLLCDEIRKHTKVVLTGEGADEFFGGYLRYAIWQKLERQETFARLPGARFLPDWPGMRSIRRLAGLDGPSYASMTANIRHLAQVFPALAPAPRGAREAASATQQDFRKRLLAVDQTAYLESLLVRQDKMSMAASVEARVPFVHLPLIKLANRLPTDIRIPGGTTKPVLKAFAEKFLPKDVIHRRKIGLWLPYDKWLRDDRALGRYLDLVADPNGRLAAYSSNKSLAAVIDRFRRNDPTVPKMWNLVNMELWLRSLP